MSQTLLLVDDEPNILRALSRLLRRDGYTILTAGSAKEGLEMLESHPEIEVIISDQRMPEMSGVEFLCQVKKQHPSIIRIILSGFSDLNTIIDAINKGSIFRFINKPWDDDVLRNNIKDAFRHYQLYNLSDDELSHLWKGSSKSTFLESLLDTLPAAIIAVDKSQDIRYCNQLANQLFPTNTLIHGQCIADCLPQITQLNSGETIKIEGETYRVEINNDAQENQIFFICKI